MKTKNQMKPLARLIATSLAVGTMAGFGAQVYAQTAAGTLIKNLATVTYEDENGNEYSAQSNEAVVTVAPVYFATLENDNNLSGAPGQTVYFPHTLTNTGNIADSYTVAATSGSTVYLDENNNGQPDPGEPVVYSTDENGNPVEQMTTTVAAGEQANFVIALPIPETAEEGDTLNSILTVASDNSGEVSDVGDNADKATDDSNATDNDPNSATNLDTATVSTGPVLVLNKSSVHDVANQKITYTLTVKNNGGSDATNVSIEDILPLVDHDADSDITTPTDKKQVELVAGSITTNGLVNAGDAEGAAGLVTDAGDIDEDGNTSETFDGIVATDVTLPPNTTISVTYTVSYAKIDTGDALEWAAGEDIDNTFTASSDEITVPVKSNTTNDVIPMVYGVDALDTGRSGDPGLNDGGDDDSDATTDVAAAGHNDVQYVDVAPTGGEVKFKHVITNDGNGDDTFNLDVVSVDFPPNTVFTFWDESGTVQLTDTDNDGVPDTGTLSQDESSVIMVKAKLPAGYSDDTAGADPSYTATLTATSSGDVTVKDTTTLELGSITAPSLDIANKDLTGDQGMTGFNDGGVENAQNESPAKLVDAEVGGVAVFDMSLANESGSADSFLLTAGNIPSGWDVTFKDEAGNIITTTPLIPGGGVYNYTAEVTVSADPSEAMSDSERAADVDGYDASNSDTTNSLVPGIIDAGTDGDKDYQIEFSAASTATPGLTDTVTNSIDVIPNREVVITPNGQNQIQPGGTVDYSHKIENNGNIDEPVEVAVSNSLANEGWTTVIKVDTTGDGVPDSNLVPGTSTIKGIKPDGTYVDIPVTYVGDKAQMTIPAGVDVPLISVVNSPSNAPLGSVDSSVISVSDNTGEPNPSPTVTAQDQTNVILGQVRLDKKAAIDTNCDGTPDLATGAYAANQTTKVNPGECVVWRLTATNEGNAIVQSVTISDSAPDFTMLVDDRLKLCLGNATCEVEPLPASNSVTDAAHTSASGVVTFKPMNTIDINGVTFNDYLKPGEKLTAEFTVKVD